MMKANSLRLEFSAESEVVSFLKRDEKGTLPWTYTDDKLVLEFNDDPDMPLKPRNSPVTKRLFELRSPSVANATLSGSIFALRHAMELPREIMLQLADALQRVLDQGDSVKFLYGLQDGPGKPKRDVFEEFQITYMIESTRTSIGRLASSRKGTGAFEVVKSLLEFEKIYLEEAELKRTRQKVLSKLREDVSYLWLFVQFMKEKGYLVKQVN